MTKHDGGPAFPSVNEVRIDDIITNGHAGMSMRDWFAGVALSGFAGYSGERADILSANPEIVAKTAYRWADAMLRAREE